MKKSWIYSADEARADIAGLLFALVSLQGQGLATPVRGAHHRSTVAQAPELDPLQKGQPTLHSIAHHKNTHPPNNYCKYNKASTAPDISKINDTFWHLVFR